MRASSWPYAESIKLVLIYDFLLEEEQTGQVISTAMVSDEHHQIIWIWNIHFPLGASLEKRQLRSAQYIIRCPHCTTETQLQVYYFWLGQWQCAGSEATSNEKPLLAGSFPFYTIVCREQKDMVPASAISEEASYARGQTSISANTPCLASALTGVTATSLAS